MNTQGTDLPDTARLEVVHSCAPAAVGGLERVVQDLSAGLLERGHRVTTVAVVEPDAEIGPFVEPLEAAGVDTIVLRVGGRAYGSELQEVGAYLDRLAPDVLHTHGYRSDVLHGWLARRRGIPTVTTLHGYSWMGGASFISEWLQKRSLKRFDAVVTVSGVLTDIVAEAGVERHRIHEVPNAWRAPEHVPTKSEARARLGLTQEAAVVGWVGRLAGVKGCDVFLDALAALPDGAWIGCVVGDGPERVVLEQRADRLGLQERVVFTGEVAGAGTLFRAFDLFVLSSRSEGTPMALLEAMGSGVPVVATAVGGVPNVIRRHVDGWLVPSEAPDRLAEAIEEALSDDALAQARATAARERLRTTFDSDGWVARHEEIYRGIARRGPQVP